MTSDVTVKVTDSTLELYDTVDERSRREAKGHRSIVNEGRYRGTIDLPNYIDSVGIRHAVDWITSPARLPKRNL